MYRQGDILLIKIKKPDVSNLTKITGSIILGYGEATGHKHQIQECAVAFAPTEKDLEEFALVGGNQVIIINVTETTALKHEEHDPITIDPGWYTPIRQREYEPERLRYVAD